MYRTRRDPAGPRTNRIMEPKADIAVIGLAVMGRNLILNMNDHGFTVAAFNLAEQFRTPVIVLRTAELSTG